MAVHRIEKKITIKNENENYNLVINAENGTTHESAFYNVQNKLIILNNGNTKGELGKGSDLKGKTIVVKSNAENNTPDINSDVDQITLKYFIATESGKTQVAEYDKPEDEDDYPTIKLKIVFE